MTDSSVIERCVTKLEAQHGKVLADHKRALELLEWAIDTIKQSQRPRTVQDAITHTHQIVLDPNWSSACIVVADAKAKGII